MGVKGAVENKARVDQAARTLATITGQHADRPQVARRPISGFKLREGMPIAARSPCGGERMWEFADRLISIVLPRIRDFRGVKDKLDGRGNFTMGLSEQTVFPEIDFDKVEFLQGMDITFVTSAGTDEHGYAAQGARDAVQKDPRNEGQEEGLIDGQDLPDRQVQRPAEVQVADYTRCSICGRARAVYRKFGICRICLRETSPPGRDPRHAQGVLVSRSPDHDDRSDRRHAHA